MYSLGEKTWRLIRELKPRNLYESPQNLWPSSVGIDKGNQNCPLWFSKVEDEDAQDDDEDESPSELLWDSDIEVDEWNESDEST